MPTASAIRFLSFALILAQSGSLVAQRVAHRLLGPSSGSAFGSSLANAGDIDRDGHDDLIVGAPGDDRIALQTGTVLIFSGADGRVLRSHVGPNTYAAAGSGVGGAGDVDGDGYADYVFGQPGFHDAGVLYVGSVEVHSGRDGSLIHRFVGTAEFGYLGIAVAGAGDADGDGYDDIVAGAWNVGRGAGAVYVWSGRTGRLLHTVNGPPTEGRELGRVVAGVGDVDGDGYDDFAAGAPDAENSTNPRPGAVIVRSGRTGGNLYAWSGDRNGDRYGAAIAGVGDIDGDGHADVAIGAPRVLPTSFPGYVEVRSGADGSILHRWAEDSPPGLWFGAAVAGGIDLDGDRIGDVLIGVPSAPRGLGGGKGEVRAFSGASGAPLFQLQGQAQGDWFGGALASAGDTDGDGVREVAVGVLRDDQGGENAGAVEILTWGPFPDAAIARPRGAGCPGSNGGLPRIDWDRRPQLGATLELSLRAARPFAPTVLNIGTRVAVPLEPFGLPACTLLAADDQLIGPFTTDAAGQTRVAVTVPPQSSALGIAVAGQWIVIDPAANAFGATLSDSVDLTIGR